MGLPILDILNIGMGLIDKLVPDPQKKAEMQLEMMRLQQQGELTALQEASQVAQAQIAVNQADAASGSKFQAWWRPFIGWTCGGAFFLDTIIRPLVMWYALVFDKTVVLPSLDGTTLYGVLFGLLGLGSLRTVEKITGRAK